MTDPHDPLRGLDPYPRERIEGLHRERAELLEEIVSTPAPGKQPARAKLLLAAGIAAALVLVGGGVAWIAVSGDDDTKDGQVAAGTTSPTTATDSSAPPSATATDGTSGPAAVTLAHARKGDVLSRDECRRARTGRWVDVMLTRRSGRIYYLKTGLGRRPPHVAGKVLRVGQLRKQLDYQSWLIRHQKQGRWVVLDADCKVLAVGRGGRPLRLPGLLGQRPHR